MAVKKTVLNIGIIMNFEISETRWYPFISGNRKMQFIPTLSNAIKKTSAMQRPLTERHHLNNLSLMNSENVLSNGAQIALSIYPKSFSGGALRENIFADIFDDVAGMTKGSNKFGVPKPITPFPLRK